MRDQENNQQEINNVGESSNTGNVPEITGIDRKMVAKQKKKRRTIIWVSSIILFFVAVSLMNQQPIPPPGQILAKGPLYGRGFKSLMLKFSTDDISNIIENKTTAETFLPDLIVEADQMKVDSIVIQAVQRKNTMLIFSSDTSYGYVWQKDKDGKWRDDDKSNKDSY